MSIYTEAKNSFIDEINPDEYIEIDSSKAAYEQLADSLNKSLKMILLFGRPGTGKSLLLSRLYKNLKHQKELYYFDTPATTKREFFEKLFTVLTGKELPTGSVVNFETFVKYLKVNRAQREIVILIDEAQVYPEEVLEDIRILSDSGTVKFVISLHKTENEDLIAKEHFQTRIWETIELKNALKDELKIYIHKKLLKRGLFNIANIIKDRHISLIHRFTKGNYRETNKLMYNIFEIYEYYDNNNQSKIDHKKFSKKIIEMAAIKIGYINV